MQETQVWSLNLPATAGNAGDKGLIPGSGRSPGEGNGNPLQYSCLGNPMDGAAWQAIVHEAAKSQTDWLSTTTTTTTGNSVDHLLVLGLVLMGFRKWYPKIWPFGTMSILSWRNLKKLAEAGSSFSPPVLHPRSSSTGPQVRGTLSMPAGKKETSSYPRWTDSGKESEQTGLAKFPQFTTLSSSSLSYLSRSFHSLSVAQKHSGLPFLLVFISLWRLSCHIQLILHKSVYFPLLICLCQSNFWTQLGILRDLGKTFSSPTLSSSPRKEGPCKSVHCCKPAPKTGEGHGTPLQYSCLENPMDRRAWSAVVHGVAKSWTQLKRLST